MPLFRSKSSPTTSRAKMTPSKPYPYVYSYSLPHQQQGSSPRYKYSYLPTHPTPSPPTLQTTSSDTPAPAPDSPDLVPHLLHLHAKALSLGRLQAHLRQTKTHLPQAPPSLRYEVRQLEFDVGVLRTECLSSLVGDVPPAEPEVKELLLRTLFLCASLGIGSGEEYLQWWDWVMRVWYDDLERRERENERTMEEWRALGRQVEWEREFGGSGRKGRAKVLERKREELGKMLRGRLGEWEEEVKGLYERVRVECG